MYILMSNWLLASGPLTPHGFCLLWRPWLIWAFVIGDSATALAYFAIPLALAKFAQQRRDLAFKPLFWLFAAFILLCGTTHWLELMTIWVPAYNLEASLKLITAVVSVATTFALWRLLPLALALPSPAQMREANEALLASECELRALNASLEAKVEERTAALQANQDQLRDLLTTLDLGTFITRDLDGKIRFWSDGCTRLYGWTAAEAAGRSSHELLRTTFPLPLAELNAILEREGAWTGELRHTTRTGHEVMVTARNVLRRDPAGRPVAVLEALTDVTDMRRFERERQRADALLRGIIAAAPGLLYAKDLQGRLLLANGQFTDLVGKPWAEIDGHTDAELLGDTAQAAAVMSNDRQIMNDGMAVEIEEQVGEDHGRPRVWLSSKAPMRGSDGVVEGLVGVSIEITERKRTEERLHLMVHELNHRVKNTLATVQSIAWQTLRTIDPDIRQNLEGRLTALASAHDILTRETWHSADIDDVVAAVGHGIWQGNRIEASGPPLRLVPQAALALALALHELATNALKHGAFSPAAEHGAVELRWEATAGRLRLTWQERGCSHVPKPQRRGLGTRLIERILAQDLRGSVRLAFDAPGMSCTFEAPLSEVIVSTLGERPLLQVDARL